ncbi:MAG: effector binding domain-containing protein [Candidatus Thorarchaeota archaeon]
MTDEIIKIVYLPLMRVASFHAMGNKVGEPELKVWKDLKNWAKVKGILDNPTENQIFGFNNPAPLHINEGKPYGYELWITIGKDFKVEDNIRTKTVEGGMYAVITSKMEEESIGNTWQKLFQWIQESADYNYHPNWKPLHDRYDEDYVKHGVFGLEYIPDAPLTNKEKFFIMDIYGPLIKK